MINGSLVGMVSICAGADRYYPWAACVIAGIFKFSIFSLTKTSNPHSQKKFTSGYFKYDVFYIVKKEFFNF